jgi:hypothetical protein
MIPHGGDANDPHEKARLNNVPRVRDFIHVRAAQVARNTFSHPAALT